MGSDARKRVSDCKARYNHLSSVRSRERMGHKQLAYRLGRAAGVGQVLRCSSLSGGGDYKRQEWLGRFGCAPLVLPRPHARNSNLLDGKDHPRFRVYKDLRELEKEQHWPGLRTTKEVSNRGCHHMSRKGHSPSGIQCPSLVTDYHPNYGLETK